MKNFDRVKVTNEIFDRMEKGHINLYHDISKNDFEKQKQEFLQGIDKLTNTQVLGGLLRLVALFKEAHTEISTWCYNYQINVEIDYIGDNYYLVDKSKNFAEKITHINDYPIEMVVEKLSGLVCYEEKEWLQHKLKRILRNQYYLYMVDLDNCEFGKIKYTLSNGKTIIAGGFADYEQKKPYEFELKNDVLIVSYRKCREDENYPFKLFMEDIKTAIKDLPSACLVDVRDNSGGDSLVVLPLIKWLKQNKIKTYALMNNGTFSAGIFTVAQSINGLNAVTLGENCGQSGYNYGERKEETINGLEGVSFSYSTKLFNLTSLDMKSPVPEYPLKYNKAFNYLGAIKPDIRIERRVEDLRAGVDGQLNDTLEWIEKDLSKERGNTAQD